MTAGTVRFVVELRRGWYFFALGPLTDRAEYEVLAAHYFLQDRSTLCDRVHPFKVTPSTSPVRTFTRWNATEHCGVVSLCETCRKSIGDRWKRSTDAAEVAQQPSAEENSRPTRGMDGGVFRVDVGAVEPVVLHRSRRRKRSPPKRRRAR